MRACGAVSAGVAAPGVGSTAVSAAFWRMCRRKEVIYLAEGGATPVGTGYVLPSSEVYRVPLASRSLEDGGTALAGNGLSEVVSTSLHFSEE